MNKRTDVLIAGAGPAGIVCAVTAKKYYPSKNIAVINNIPDGVIPCGIPYMFASLQKPDDNKMGMALLEQNKVDSIADEAVQTYSRKRFRICCRQCCRR